METVTVPLWILVKPDKDGAFQGIYSSKGGEVVWTSYESGHSLPRFFLDKQEALDFLLSPSGHLLLKGAENPPEWVPLEVKLTIPEIGSSLSAWE